MDTDRLWRGQTLHDRATARREQLMRAGVELLGTAGAPAVTVRAVCQHAGVSLRYFYESFPDREALLVAVHDHAVDQIRAAAISAIGAATGDLADRVRVAFNAVADLLTADSRIGRIVFRETLADDTLRHHGIDVVPTFIRLVADNVLAPENTTIDATDLELTIKAMAGAHVALFLDWLDGHLTATRDQLVDYCVRLTLAMFHLAESR